MRARAAVPKAIAAAAGSEGPVNQSSLIERAFELSASGACRDIIDLERRLKREGFEGVSAHLSGKSLRRQLADAIRRAAGAPGEAN